MKKYMIFVEVEATDIADAIKNIKKGNTVKVEELLEPETPVEQESSGIGFAR